jgi:hypothetical protein
VIQFSDRVAPRDVERLLSSVRAQLVDVAAVEVGSAPAGEEALCVVIVDVEAAGLRLRFEDGTGGALGQPRTIPPNSAEVMATEVATIVRSLVLALGERGRVPESRSETAGGAPTASGSSGAPSAPPTPASSSTPPPPESTLRRAPEYLEGNAPESPPPTFRGRFRGLYTGTIYAAELPWQNGMRLEAMYVAPRWFVVGVGYAFNPPVEVAGPDAVVHVARQAGSAFVGLEQRLALVSYGIDAALVVADTLRSTTSAAAPFEASAASSRLGVGGAMRVFGLVRIPGFERLHADLLLGVEAFPTREAFVTQGANGEASVLSPYAFRPEVGAGMGFDAW